MQEKKRMISELFTIKFFDYRIVTFLPAQSLRKLNTVADVLKYLIQ